jgi:hypothetical protein
MNKSAEKCDIDDDDDWVELTQDHEEKVLEYCWVNLPLQMSLDEFQEHMKTLKRNRSHINLMDSIYFVLQSLWTISGYASTIFTLAKHRQLLIQLILWYLS